MKSIVNDGFLILDKPKGLTSRQLVDRVKTHTSKKVGHTGTLDPLATGMMVIAIGDATRFSQDILSQDKAYTATIQLGSQTNTDDMEGESIHTSNTTPSESEILDAIKDFEGNITQVPPQFSAIHVNGKRAYKLARQSKEFTLKERNITIYEIKLLSYIPDTRVLTLYIHCQSGTYIRSIARDLGQRLKCYGHLKDLRREWIAPFSSKTMHTIDELPKPTLSLDEFFNQEHIELTYQQALDLAHGKILKIDGDKTLPAYYNDTFLGFIEPHKGHYKACKLRSNILSLIQSI